MEDEPPPHRPAPTVAPEVAQRRRKSLFAPGAGIVLASSQGGSRRKSVIAEEGVVVDEAPKQKNYDISMCLSLLVMFDFQQQGYVTRDDWRKGTAMMMLEDMGEDDLLWETLLKKYDPGRTGDVPMAVIQDLVPVDPRMLVMFRSMVVAVSGLSDKLIATQRKLEAQSNLKTQRAILNIRRKILEPVRRGLN
jgi:hypothetical protein